MQNLELCTFFRVLDYIEVLEGNISETWAVAAWQFAAGAVLGSASALGVAAWPFVARALQGS